MSSGLTESAVKMLETTAVLSLQLEDQLQEALYNFWFIVSQKDIYILQITTMFTEVYKFIFNIT